MTRRVSGVSPRDRSLTSPVMPVTRGDSDESRGVLLESRRDSFESRRVSVETRADPFESQRDPFPIRGVSVETRGAPFETGRDSPWTRAAPREARRARGAAAFDSGVSDLKVSEGASVSLWVREDSERSMTGLHDGESRGCAARRVCVSSYVSGTGAPCAGLFLLSDECVRGLRAPRR